MASGKKPTKLVTIPGGKGEAPADATPAEAKRGRKEIPIDLELVGKLAAIGCTNDEIALVLGIDRATFYRRMKRGKGARELCDALEKGRAEGRTSLRRKQFELATKGNVTMLIWLGKQLLGQRDKVAAEVGEMGSLDEEDRKRGERELLAMLERAAGKVDAEEGR